MLRRLPNLLSLTRLAAVPVLAALAFTGRPSPTLLLFAAALVTDALDGFLARRLGCVSERGARLDSLGDLGIWLVFPICVWWLWPDLVERELTCVMIALASFAAPLAAGILKFGRLTSYHTWGAKFAAVAMSAGLLGLFGFGEVWLFYAATSILALAAVEELAITTILVQWKCDVPTVVHALMTRA